MGPKYAFQIDPLFALSSNLLFPQTLSIKLAAMYLYVNLSSIDLFSCILSPEGTEGGGPWTTKA